MLVQVVLAQGSSSSSSTQSEPAAIPRIWVGVDGSYTPLRLTSGVTESNSTTGEVISTKPANGQVGAGLNVNVRVFRQFWLNAGGTYRFGGLDTMYTSNDISGDVFVYRTRARYFDFPLLVRYSGSKHHWSRYLFFEGGGALRHTTATTTSTAANYFGSECCAPTFPLKEKSNILGAVAGAGLIGRDAFGIIVAPEVRYTYWTGSTFSGLSAASEKNQLEITLTFGF